MRSFDSRPPPAEIPRRPSEQLLDFRGYRPSRSIGPRCGGRRRKELFIPLEIGREQLRAPGRRAAEIGGRSPGYTRGPVLSPVRPAALFEAALEADGPRFGRVPAVLWKWETCARGDDGQVVDLVLDRRGR